LKKKLTLILILPFIISFCQLDGDEKLGNLANDDSIIAHYPLDGDAKDMSGNGHDGVLYYTTPDNDRYGNAGKALHFDGMNSYVEIPAEKGINLSDTAFTISVWIYVDSTASTRTILSCLYDSTSEFFRPYIDSAGNLAPYFQMSAGTDYYIYSSVWTWYHITYVWDKQYLRLYVNSVLMYEDYFNTLISYTGNQMTLIGAQWMSSYAGNFFNGNIDNLTIFKRALSESEVKTLYENSM